MNFFKSLAEKITQLEDLTLKKEKFIQSNKMIVKFREDQIMRLERLQKEARGRFLPEEQDRLLSELRDEIQTLREQVSASPGHISREELQGTHEVFTSSSFFNAVHLTGNGSCIISSPFSKFAAEDRRKGSALCPVITPASTELSLSGVFFSLERMSFMRHPV